MMYVHKIMAIIITYKRKVNSFYLVCTIYEVFLLSLSIYMYIYITNKNNVYVVLIVKHHYANSGNPVSAIISTIS